MSTSFTQPTSVGIDIEQERQAFEHWFSDGGKWPKAVERDQRGQYLLMAASTGWQTWQATAASIQQRYALTPLAQTLSPAEHPGDQASHEADPPPEHFVRPRR